jgi:PAS domain S-box-containing protein
MRDPIARLASAAARCASIEDLVHAALACVDGAPAAAVWSRFGQARWHVIASRGEVPGVPPEHDEDWHLQQVTSRHRTTVFGVSRLQEVATDITLVEALLEGGLRRLEAEAVTHAATQAGEERLATILDATPDAVVVISLSGEVLHANLRATELFGYSLDELVGDPVDKLVPAEVRDHHRGHRDGYAAAPTSRSMAVGQDLRALRRDGTEVPVDIALEPMEIEGRSAVAAFIRDATARRAAEEQRQRAAREELAKQQAMELNDNVVQGLTSAIWLLELDELHAGLATARETLASAQAIMADLMGGGSADIDPQLLQRESAAPPAGLVPDMASPGDTPAAEPSPLRVVIADDSEDLRLLLRVRLEGAGIDVVATARDGQEAVDAVDEHQPDVVIMDLSMPVLDGLQATGILRQQYPALRIVVLSGHPRDAMLEQTLAAGADAYIQKGSDFENLLDAIRLPAGAC